VSALLVLLTPPVPLAPPVPPRLPILLRLLTPLMPQPAPPRAERPPLEQPVALEARLQSRVRWPTTGFSRSLSHR
jgi:hypothetical protein